MLLKSIKLENIRSYVSEEIEFPNGSILLAGDIGSGKSTILLAIEFSLFGLKPGELSGVALLRHGAKEGAVELVFSSDGRDIIVRRTLKRSRDKIGQAAGYVIVDGVKEDLMPKEIRARVFEILNYPESLVSKGQDLIYRFTVYTPQEQMKQIIYEDKDSRLDTLRKVFNIDKYKRIRENALIYVKSLKEKRNNYEGRIADLDEKKRQKDCLEKDIALLSSKEKEVSESFILAKDKTQQSKEKLAKLELKIKEVNDTKKEIALLDVELRNIVDKREKEKREIDEIQSIILKLRDELKDYKEVPDLETLYGDKERRVDTLDKELKFIMNEKSEIRGKVNHLKQQSEKIVELDNCPLCLQKVAHEHKKGIVMKGNEEINKLKEKFAELDAKEKNLNSNLASFKKEMNELREKISFSKVSRVRKEGLIEKERKLGFLKESFDESKKKIASVNTKKIEFSKVLEQFLEIDKDYSSSREEYDLLLQKERKQEIERNSLLKEIEGILRQLKIVDGEIAEKERIKKDLQKIVSLLNWIEAKFINLVVNMEKHVMMTVYHEFNELFQQWFSMLVEDEGINVRLDDSFSVVIEQNGYESFIENLSGGEKTAVALAYRLALNKVINDVVSQIRTKDILILDEPTEGFSTTQLDRVRDVLDQIGIKQIIIVSHESKIESFVDNVVRVNKSEGVSEIS